MYSRHFETYDISQFRNPSPKKANMIRCRNPDIQAAIWSMAKGAQVQSAEYDALMHVNVSVYVHGSVFVSSWSDLIQYDLI